MLALFTPCLHSMTQGGRRKEGFQCEEASAALGELSYAVWVTEDTARVRGCRLSHPAESCGR